ncbi:MAG: GNAT family N-acetyltransferase [Deltaproteobacteria bacterium]|nr:GNAT family N-acetyltransferase [Deltaproteobacteria bacterium]
MGHIVLHDASFDELDARTWHDLVQLRIDVFVVEQACIYRELDGRDVETTTRHLWLADERPVAYLRVLDEGNARRISRVLTRSDRRGAGLAERLVRAALERTVPPVILHAQSHLAAWYARLGFTVTGPEFLEDGIPHLPMRR